MQQARKNYSKYYINIYLHLIVTAAKTEHLIVTAAPAAAKTEQ